MPDRYLLTADRIPCRTLLDLLDGMAGEPRAIVLIGSGMSIPVGYPTWGDLTADLVRLAGLETIYPIPRGNVHWTDRLPVIIQSCWQTLTERGDESRFAEFLDKTFPREGLQGPLDVYEYVLGTDFSSFLTTNFDLSLEYARLRNSRARYVTASPVWRRDDLRPELLSDGERRTYYLHGRARDEYANPSFETLVIRQSDYDSAYGTNAPGSLRAFLSTALKEYVVLFAGYGFRDPEIDSLLIDYRDWAAESTDGRRHFALCAVSAPGRNGGVGQDPGPDECLDKLSRLGIAALRYCPESHDEAHEPLVGFFRELSRAAPYRGVALPAGKGTEVGPRQ